MNLATVEIKAFVPARNLADSIAFYEAIGFEVPWHSEDLAYVRNGETSFLLQQFYVPDHANNFMMHMLVESADDWYQHIKNLDIAARFSVRLDPPADRPWSIRDFTLVDPSGVLWRIGHSIPD